jgi:hypothetical protein
MNTDYKEALAPILESALSISQHSMALHEMFALAMSNIPDNETENFTAKKIMPAYIAFCQVLENIRQFE